MNTHRIRRVSVSDTRRVQNRHDTVTYDYTELCDFF